MTITATTTRFDFSLIHDDLQGNHTLLPYDVLDALSLWLHENALTGPGLVALEVVLLEGEGGWPLVRVLADADFNLAVAAVVWPDRDRDDLLDMIFVHKISF